MEILNIKDLTFTYPQCERAAVRGVSLAIEQGEFAVLCGDTGSGKSTLLRLLKRELAPKGDTVGSITVNGKQLSELSARESACCVGYVMQDTERQAVTDKVWHELAFGLENMNVPQQTISARVAEMASYFGIEEWYERSVCELSGGQKQLLALASVMVMDPDILILDEPTAQLDPIAASDFISTLKKLNEELSLTVIIIEHRLEELIPICDRLLVMRDGALVANGEPRDVIAAMSGDDAMMLAMPCASRLYGTLGLKGECPLTVKEGRRFIEKSYKNAVRSLERAEYVHGKEKALEFDRVSFRYERSSADVLRETSFCVYEGEIFCLLGGNGSGKTTSLGVASGVLRAYSGSVRVFGKKLKEYKDGSLYKECLALLPQDVQTVFLRNTVREELADAGAVPSELPIDIDLSGLLERHPYDLSGGEQQLVALAKVLASKPRLLLMDEPTKGLDASRKLAVAEMLRKLRASGVTVVIVTHDVEFAASCSDRCALFFRGRIASVGTPEGFFSSNNFYTTAVSRMTKGYFDGAVTLDDAVRLCSLNGLNEKRET